ncbi:hypothetical protein K490DRAFT_60635 [Saccharata proteae CBS 121410]|uniref:Uncharacterized protein n=1 Tax=Saccharata proteae CBS 121410 TaxID=1314787 RepID=A0A9P4HMI7_9PEZI|nr:hypothetical protein K490DRAFT_60635 [Saccharata proteae CBS 121410]
MPSEFTGYPGPTWRPRMASIEVEYQWGCCRCGRGGQNINFELECENKNCKHMRCKDCLKHMGVGANSNRWLCHACKKADNIVGLLCTGCRHTRCDSCQRMM